MGNNDQMETPTPLDKSRQNYLHSSQVPKSNKKDQLDAIVAATKIRQRTIYNDDESRTKIKRSSIVQNIDDELPSDLYRLNAVGTKKLSDKQLNTINLDQSTGTPFRVKLGDKDRAS